MPNGKGTYEVGLLIGFIMAHALREIFDETVDPIPVPTVEVAVGFDRATLLQGVEQFEKLCAGRAQKLRRSLMAGRAGALSALSTGLLAAPLRAEHRVFAEFERATLLAMAATLLARRDSAEMFAELAIRATDWPLSDRQFLVDLMKRYDRAMALHSDAQKAMADFFSEAAATAGSRFEYLTTDPHAYDDYVDEVISENPDIMARFAR